MILEHFTDNKNNSIEYNEDDSVFMIRNNKKSLLNLFNLGNTRIYEYNSSINTINKLKQEADKTTLTEDDIDTMYNFAQKAFNYKGTKSEFESAKLKDIFVGVGKNNMAIHKLAPLSYDYMTAIKRGETPIIEKFTANTTLTKLQSKSKTNKIISLISILSLLSLALLIILMCLYFLPINKN